MTLVRINRKKERLTFSPVSLCFFKQNRKTLKYDACPAVSVPEVC